MCDRLIVVDADDVAQLTALAYELTVSRISDANGLPILVNTNLTSEIDGIVGQCDPMEAARRFRDALRIMEFQFSRQFPP